MDAVWLKQGRDSKQTKTLESLSDFTSLKKNLWRWTLRSNDRRFSVFSAKYRYVFCTPSIFKKMGPCLCLNADSTLKFFFSTKNTYLFVIFHQDQTPFKTPNFDKPCMSKWIQSLPFLIISWLFCDLKQQETGGQLFSLSSFYSLR